MTAHEGLRRVVVVGTTGSGKTTFAAALAAVRGLRHVELDSLHWGANWTPRERDTFRTAAWRLVPPMVGCRWQLLRGSRHPLESRGHLDLAGLSAAADPWPSLPPYRSPSDHARGGFWHGNRERLLDQFRWHDSLFVWCRAHPRPAPARLSTGVHQRPLCASACGQATFSPSRRGLARARAAPPSGTGVTHGNHRSA